MKKFNIAKIPMRTAIIITAINEIGQAISDSPFKIEPTVNAKPNIRLSIISANPKKEI